MTDLVETPLQDRLKRIFDDAGGSDTLVDLLAEFGFEGSEELADTIVLAMRGASRIEALEAELARVKALGDADCAKAWNKWWNSVSTGVSDKHMQTAFTAGFDAALEAWREGDDV